MQRDPYGRRLAGALLVVVVGAYLAAILGPEAEPEREWFEHTGVEGEIEIIDAIEVVRDDDPVTAREARHMANATEGIPSPITEKVVNENNPDPVFRERERGQQNVDPEVVPQDDPESRNATQNDAYVEMNRSAQQSDQFVLLHSVHPGYPSGVAPALRQRELVVRVNMYVDEGGHVTHAYVDRNDGGPRFETVVLEAVKQWIYKPVVIDGEPTGFWDTIYFVFRVGPGRDAVEVLDRLRKLD